MAIINTKTVNIAGLKFGRLTVKEKSPILSHAGALWLCVCDCGNNTVANSLKLRKGYTISCGCYKASLLGSKSRTHGRSQIRDRTYKTWKEMRHRCSNPGADNWKYYGGRGIVFCQRWDKFENFLADMGERPIGKTLDRKDSDGYYSPENCRWATPKEQAVTNRGCFRRQMKEMS